MEREVERKREKHREKWIYTVYKAVLSVYIKGVQTDRHTHTHTKGHCSSI